MSAPAPKPRIEATNVGFEMEDGSEKFLPPSYGQIHDESGSVLPKCEVFFAPQKRTREPAEMTRANRRYFGADHKAVVAWPDIPKSGWEEVGRVRKIFYVRRGRRAPGGFHHPFNASRNVMLWKSGRCYRITLGDGCLVDDRGFRWP